MIGIVTVLYNSSEVLEGFFKSLALQEYKNYRIYIIDNNSRDDSLSKAKVLAKDCKIDCIFFEENQNWGIAKGNNIGIEHALNDQCDYILLANNDIEFPPHTISSLLKGMAYHHASLAVPKIYYWSSGNVIWAAGGKFGWLRCNTPHFGAGQADCGQFDCDKEIEYAPTCFMLIKSEVFRQIGMMDEKYFVYYDDTDFIWRATKIAKLPLFFIYKSIVYHKASFSTGGPLSDFTFHQSYRNKIYFALKNYSFFHKCTLFFYLFIRYFIKDIYTMDKSRLKLLRKSYIEGFQLYYNKV